MNAARVMHRNVHHVVDDFRGRCRDGHMNRHSDVLDVRDGVVMWPWENGMMSGAKKRTMHDTPLKTNITFENPYVQ